MALRKFRLPHRSFFKAAEVSFFLVVYRPGKSMYPLLNLRRGQVIGSAGLGHSGLALDDVQDQGRLSLGRPSSDVVVHLGAHRCFLSLITPEQEFTGSIHLTGCIRARYTTH